MTTSKTYRVASPGTASDEGVATVSVPVRPWNTVASVKAEAAAKTTSSALIVKIGDGAVRRLSPSDLASEYGASLAEARGKPVDIQVLEVDPRFADLLLSTLSEAAHQDLYRQPFGPNSSLPLLKEDVGELFALPQRVGMRAKDPQAWGLHLRGSVSGVPDVLKLHFYYAPLADVESTGAGFIEGFPTQAEFVETVLFDAEALLQRGKGAALISFSGDTTHDVKLAHHVTPSSLKTRKRMIEVDESYIENEK